MPFSPEPVAHLSQNKLLPMMLQRVRECENVSVEFCKEVLECGSTENGAFVSGVGDEGEWRIDAEAVVVANGANSTLVTELGIPLQTIALDSGQRGGEERQSLLSVHFHSLDLAQEIARQPAMLYFAFNAEVVLVLVVHNLREGEFVAQVPFFPPLQKVADFGREECVRFIQAAAGVPLRDVKVQELLVDTSNGLLCIDRVYSPLGYESASGCIVSGRKSFSCGRRCACLSARWRFWNEYWNSGVLLDSRGIEDVRVGSRTRTIWLGNWRRC